MNYYIKLIIFLSIIIFIYFLILLFQYIKTDFLYYLYQKRKLPKHIEEILLKEFPLYKKIPKILRKRLIACILVFIKNKEFIGKGVVIDDRKKILIAANACILTIGHNRCEYKNVKTIYIYPDTIFKKENIQNGWIVTQQNEILLGEAWQGGEVVISWKDLVLGDKNPNDGKNVGIHEFAHQLDFADFVADGTPELPPKLYPKWTKIMKKEFKKLKELYKKHKKGFLDYYAINSEAEFFAVATEAFFEKPINLKKSEPNLYNILKEYYKLDPATWV
ncbi:zinc-dependent peptidase [Nitrosophilus kaiyonis]|uniref:M90 family metallopeptidase n=1 Tax=Nitrosophilus kaiyonis TaxID=2930200 RepID=UPI0024932B05|nr:zinc-dependent peptidase [Nitrosophilus kaiyonis]